MTVNYDLLKWLSAQSIEVITNVAPLVAKLLGVDLSKVTGFIVWLQNATKEVLEAIEIFLNFPTVFGSVGNGLTDESGCNHPDCPCPQEYAPVVWALKAQAA